MNRTIRRGLAPAVFAVCAALALTACGSDSDSDSGSGLSGSVRVDGSSTVAPLSSVAADEFQNENSGVQVTVGTSGTGGGFEKFCKGETDANDASRPIEEDEAAICEENGVEYTELAIATDALTVVVNPDNDFVDCLTVEQLNAIWEPDSDVNNWNQVDPSFPDVALKLYGPGTDSGTFDYFTEVINGDGGASRTDYDPSEDDNIIVQGVEGSPGGLGYFGFSYFEENGDALKALEIDGGDGCVAPSAETARDGSYSPLARPVFVYPSLNAVRDNPAVKGFFDFYVANAPSLSEEALFIALNDEQQAKLESDWAEASSSS